jgi:TonB family protein
VKGSAVRRGYARQNALAMNSLSRLLALVALAGAAVTATTAADQPAPPAASGYIPCKIHQKTAAVFPLRLQLDGVVSGEVQLVLEIDLQGQLSDILLTACTRREFGEEALRAVKQWQFEPGLVDGQPVISIINLTFNFEVRGVLVCERHGPPSRDLGTFWDKFEYAPHGLATLDQQPAALQLPRPVYPRAWIEQGRAGTVVIDFFIDETGRARIPTSVADGDSLLAAAAIAAVKLWRFEPPTHRGQPVLARAQQVFVFKPEPNASPST